MGRFLVDVDYSSLIQTVDLKQVTGDVMGNLYKAEEKAIARMRSKLIQRYMVDIELGAMEAYSATKHYRTKERVIASDGTISSVKEFTPYLSTTAYVTNDKVYDTEGYVYYAIANSTAVALSSTSTWLPLKNIAVTNTDYWETVDNRYPLFIEIAMDLALYNLYARINPRNIPELRKERNREALDQLDAWASGTDTAEVLTIGTPEEQAGYSIRWGSSSEKQSNFF
jgi:hypothetical protein